MREIKLTQGQVALVDDDDYEWLSRFKWCAQRTPNRRSFYAVRYSVGSHSNRRRIYMHREIMRAPHGQQVDHENHCVVDNQKRNLRACTAKQNAANRQVSVLNTSGLKGVTLITRTGKWKGTIMIGGKNVHLGFFKSKEDAAVAYDASASCHFGEFACTNKSLGLLAQRD